MKATALATCAVATFGLVAIANPAQAQSNEDILRRLEAKIDSLSKENVSLRTRLTKIEGARPASASAKQSATEAAAGTPAPSGAREAYAANYPVKAYPAARAGCAQFGGWYVGGNAGWAFHDTTFVDPNNWIDNFGNDFNSSNVSTTRNGFTGGGQAGYNYQRGCTLFGFETDFNWADLSGTQVFSPAGGPATTLTLRDKVEWFGTARIRAGVIVDDVLLYATGGLAYANIKHSFNVTDPNIPTSESASAKDQRWGLTGGVGAEWAFMPGWSLKGEALYMRFEEKDTTFLSPAGAQNVTIKSQDSLWVARLGLNYRWGDSGKGPVVAKY